MNTEPKDFYTVTEFAKKLRVHPNTVRNMIKIGRIMAVKFGHDKRSYRIPHSEIERLIIKDLKEIYGKVLSDDE